VLHAPEPNAFRWVTVCLVDQLLENPLAASAAAAILSRPAPLSVLIRYHVARQITLTTAQSSLELYLPV